MKLKMRISKLSKFGSHSNEFSVGSKENREILLLLVIVEYIFEATEASLRWRMLDLTIQMLE